MASSLRTRIILSAWAVLIAVAVIPPVFSGLTASLALLARFPPSSSGNWFANMAGQGRTILVALAEIPVFFLVGCSVLSYSRISRTSSPLFRWLAFPIGFASASILLLGLLLTGLWFPPVMLGAVLLVLLASRPWENWRFLHPRHTDIPGAGLPLAAIAISLALFIPWMLLPETHPDAWTYHLAGPERWLALHGFSVRLAAAPLLYPFISELPSALALICGDDSAPKLLHGWWLICGMGAFLNAVCPAGKAWGFLGGLAYASTVYVFQAGKSDGVGTASALLAFSCLLAMRGSAKSRWAVPAGIMGGVLLSYKLLGFFNAVWVVAIAAILAYKKTSSGSQSRFYWPWQLPCPGTSATG